MTSPIDLALVPVDALFHEIYRRQESPHLEPFRSALDALSTQLAEDWSIVVSSRGHHLCARSRPLSSAGARVEITWTPSDPLGFAGVVEYATRGYLTRGFASLPEAWEQILEQLRSTASELREELEAIEALLAEASERTPSPEKTS